VGGEGETVEAYGGGVDGGGSSSSGGGGGERGSALPPPWLLNGEAEESWLDREVALPLRPAASYASVLVAGPTYNVSELMPRPCNGSTAGVADAVRQHAPGAVIAPGLPSARRLPSRCDG
jgi:hypothetical protein